MANADRNKLIRIYGVTLPGSKFRVKPYGHGIDEIEIEGEKFMVSYVDYFIDDLIRLIEQQDLENKFLKGLKIGE